MEPPPEVVRGNVRAALAEDVGEGDVTASLIAADATARDGTRRTPSSQPSAVTIIGR